jgi:hypothetical protein
MDGIGLIGDETSLELENKDKGTVEAAFSRD